MSEQTPQRNSARRQFLKSLTALTVAGGLSPVDLAAATQPTTDAADDRTVWLEILEKLARPVLSALAAGRLKQVMPVEAAKGADRSAFTHLEAFGRLLAGIAPWLAANGLPSQETQLQKELKDLAVASLNSATDPRSPDYLNFQNGSQTLVDTAFLAQGILRGPSVHWQPLDKRVQEQVIAALESSRKVPVPTRNNWVMFAAMIESALLMMGRPTQPERLEDCVNHMLGWYGGDGVYGDGEAFHADYYNSFVIQPMLLDVLETLHQRDARFTPAYEAVLKRAIRGAELLERLIAPDGTFPCIGRSVTYRFGAFHLLSQIAMQGRLKKSIKPAQVRSALTAVIKRMAGAEGTFDADGWLQIGFVGHQPTLGENYISTGSLYLCSVALLPLALPPSDPFWSDPPEPWTSQKVWSGQPIPADHAMNDELRMTIPSLTR